MRAPYLIERVEASALAAASQVACQRHHRLPEQGISHSWRGIEVVLGVPKIGVVEDVEEIPSGLKRKPLCQFELPPERQIDLCSAESAGHFDPDKRLYRRRTPSVQANRKPVAPVRFRYRHPLLGTVDMRFVTNLEPLTLG